MSGLISVIMVLGLLGAGAYVLINRCTLLPTTCQDASAQTTDTSTAAPISGMADPKDNGKKKKCGCCNCKQQAVGQITCDPGSGDITFTAGLSLDATCKSCAADPNLCKNAKALQNMAKNAGKNVPVTTSPADDGSTFKYNCPSGSHPNSKGVCVSDTLDPKSKKANVSGNKGGDSPGCKSGETYTNCHVVNNQMQCSCANYARSMYGYVPQRTYYADASIPKNPFRSHISYI